MMAEPIIRVDKVTRTYHVGEVDVHALRGVSLIVQRGEFVAIMGSSGSGKSTLMAIIGCLDRPSSGNYYFEGIDVARLSEAELARVRSEHLGFVFQSFNLLARTSAIENTALPLIYSVTESVDRATRVERARSVLTLLGLAGRERNTPGQLSGGEQQRVAIARALINNPSVLLADEPTGNLDSRTSHEIMNTLQTLNRERGVTIVVVTHEADIAEYADRVITMRDGEIISDVRKRKPEQVRILDMKGETGAAATAPYSKTTTSLIRRGAITAFAMMIAGAAMQALMRNKMRSMLTMLGVFIGVAALIAMVAVGQGANEAVRKQIESLGTNLLVIVPGATTMGGVRGGLGSASTLTLADAEALRREASAVGSISYLIRQSGQVQYANQNWTTSIQGVSANYPPITNWQIAQGRGISPEDDSDAGLVVVLGQTVARQLFGTTENPIGAVIQVKSVPLRVIGLLGSKGQTPFGMDQDDVIMIPFSTAERKVLGVAAPSQQQVPINWVYPAPPNPYNLQRRLLGFVNQIYVQATSPDQVQTAISQATEILARRHRIRPGDVNDFSVRNLSQIAETAESSSKIMALLLAAVASISLVVGGIGIMNILLVSVTERTREIGLRMAIGARRLHVLLQFLAEAVFLSVAGGIAGIIIGIALSKTISLAAGWPTPISPTAIAGGFLFSAAVGIFFGYYPARKAAHLDPIEALRYE
ncbi:MAG TPA: ABC transporter permease [Terriglobales bacterium]|jgi:macrolide transport system ATP-binding/permease protein|nr:ABC transporter permease [Terriglobales bacterium]